MKILYYLSISLLLSSSCFAMQRSPFSERHVVVSSIANKQKMIESLKEVERDLAPESRIPGVDSFMARSYIIENKDLIKKDLEIEQQAAQLLHAVIQKTPENFSKIPEEITRSLNISSWMNLLKSFEENQKYISLLPLSMRTYGFFSEDGLPPFDGCDYLTALNQYVDKTFSQPHLTSVQISNIEHFLEDTIKLAEEAAKQLKENHLSFIPPAKDPTFDLEEDNWNFFHPTSPPSPEEIALYHHNFLNRIQDSRSLLDKIGSKKIFPLPKPQHTTKMGDVIIQFSP